MQGHSVLFTGEHAVSQGCGIPAQSGMSVFLDTKDTEAAAYSGMRLLFYGIPQQMKGGMQANRIRFSGALQGQK